MRRAQRGIYVRQVKVTPALKLPEVSVTSTARAGLRTAALTILSKHQSSSGALAERNSYSRLGRIARGRRTVQRIAGLNAGLSWAATWLGYFVVSRQKDKTSDSLIGRNGLVGAICLISLLQVGLLVLYWIRSLELLETLRISLKLNSVPIRRLRKSRRAALCCAGECLLHLVVLWPVLTAETEYEVFGARTATSLDDVSYLVVLCRNYHTVRLIYWWSRFSGLRTLFFAKVVDVSVNSLFVLRCYLANFGVLFVLLLYALTVLFFSLLQFTLVKEAQNLHGLFDNFWIVTSAQATLGYGDSAPVVFSGQFGLVFSCFCGIVLLGFVNSFIQNQLTLNSRECSLYSELLYSRTKQRHLLKAVELVQRWWRLMRMRLHKGMDGTVVVAFYSYLPQYRSVLTACQRVIDRRFERQVRAFEKFTHRHFRAVNEYMAPVHDSLALVGFTQTFDIVRKEYQIFALADRLLRHRRPFLRVPVTSATPSSSEALGDQLHKSRNQKYSKSARSVRGLARARLEAHQNLKFRLIRDDASHSVQSGENSARTQSRSYDL